MVDRIRETRARALWLPPEQRLWRPGAVEDDLDERIDRAGLARDQAAVYADWEPPDISEW